MRESADILVTEQPGDLRNLQCFVGQMPLCQISLELLQNAGKS